MKLQEKADDIAWRILSPLGLTQTAFPDRDKEMARVTALVRVAISAGLDKGAEIAKYWREYPGRNDAWRAACSDVEVSCRATAGRVSRGEYEDSTSTVMKQSEKDLK